MAARQYTHSNGCNTENRDVHVVLLNPKHRIISAARVEGKFILLGQRRLQLPGPFISDFGSKHRPKPVPPRSDRLLGDINVPLMEEFFDNSQ